MPPTRLLFLSERFTPDIGGMARSAARIASSIAGLGASVHVLAWTRQLPSGVVQSTDGISLSPALSGVTLHRVGRFASWDTSFQHTLNILEWLHERHAFSAVWG